MLKKNLILPTIISEMDELNILNGKILNPGSFQISENALKRSLTLYKEDIRLEKSGDVAWFISSDPIREDLPRYLSQVQLVYQLT